MALNSDPTVTQNNPMPTDFEQKVLEVVKKIPKGKVLSYKEVAKLAGKPRAWRVAGNILSRNKNPNIPCHRVIRSDGKPGGYNKGPKKKLQLLRKEGVTF